MGSAWAGSGGGDGSHGGDDKCAGAVGPRCVFDWYVEDQIGWKPGCERSTRCILKAEFNVLMTVSPWGRGASAGTKLTGQMHHAVSRRVHNALEDHPNLAGKYAHRDPRFVTQAVDRNAHNGYETWHRELDDEVAEWIGRRSNLTEGAFEGYLRDRYAGSDLAWRFPNGF
jgi:hypothetical protein